MNESEKSKGTEHGENRSARLSARDRSRQHRQPNEPIEDSGSVTSIEQSSDDELDPTNPTGLIAQSISYQGPLPHPTDLQGYEQLSPGAATKLIDAHVYKTRAGSDALTRITKAEAFGVTFGVVTSGLLLVGGLTAGVILVLLDRPLAATFLGIVPVIGGALTGVITAIKSPGGDQKNSK